MKERFNIKLKEIIGGLTWKKIFYPALVSIFALMILIIFIVSVRFISKNINRIFINEVDVESQMPRLDLEHYLPVAKKLGIPMKNPEPYKEILDGQAVGPQTPIRSVGEVSTSSATSSQDSASNIQLLRVGIYNSTNIHGLAQDLKNILEEKGFEVSETGNMEKTNDHTVIKIKESRKDALEKIKTIVGEYYRIDESPFLPENSEFDIIIIIGDK